MRQPLSILAALSLVTACDNGTPLQPDDRLLTAAPALAAGGRATTVPFAAILAVTGVLSPSDTVYTGKVVHIRGGDYVWDTSGDLTGTFVATGDWLLHKSGLGTGSGPWYMVVTNPCIGGFEGNWHGVLDPDFNGTLLGQGTDGCRGITLKADFWPVTPGNIFVQHAVGTLHSSNARTP